MFIGSSGPPDRKDSAAEEETRQISPQFPEDGLSMLAPAGDSSIQLQESARLLGAIGNDGSGGKSKDGKENPPEVMDPLAGMPVVDKWGIKGLRTLMNNYPDYHAMVVGMDPNSLGLDMASQE